MNKKIAIVGAGFAGAVLARELAASGRFQLIVFDERNHIAGNCLTSRDEATNVMIHHYGPHIFNTNREDVWNYVNQFAKFGPFVNRVKAITARGKFPLPINLRTINQFFNKNFTPAEAEKFIENLGDKTIPEPANLEEQALKFIGRDLYENFIKGYTQKQWGVDPRELPASILKRLPVRFTDDDNYYNSKFQGIPLNGYTEIVQKLLESPAIEVRLGRRFNPTERNGFDHVFFSGPLDSYFNFELGRLGYRSLRFERFDGIGDVQGNAVINYCEEKVPYTRVAEHKHFTPWEKHDKSVLFREYSSLAKEGDVPYYPIRLAADHALLSKYTERADGEKNVTFIGRLGTYRYLDMHMVIGESLDLANLCLKEADLSRWPKFSVRPQ